MKAEYRQDILQKKTSFATIKAKFYSQELQALDSKWADEHRKFIKTIKDTEVLHVSSYYDSDYFIGYFIGPVDLKNKNLLANPYIDKNGVGHKVFFELKKPLEDLSPQKNYKFARALADKGFHGDFKIQVAAANIRYHFNNIVVHARSLKDALLVEKSGLEFWSGSLAATSRGVDVDLDVNGKTEAYDWSEFLCAHSVAKLPNYAKKFVEYK